MQSTSFAFRRQMADNTKVALKATLTFADGTVRELTGEDFAMGGISVTTATSTTGSFDIGAAVMGSCEVTLANYDQRFDACDFEGATIVPWCGVEFEDGTVEWLRLGTFGVEQPKSYSSTIGLHCLDNLRLLDVPYSEVSTVYPASLSVIVRELCAACDLLTVDDAFPNYDYIVVARPDDERLTCLDVLSYAAQAAGCHVTCDVLGRVSLGWYDTSVYEGEPWLDGGSYGTEATPYSDGDTADGGGFMTGGSSFDGGSFTESPWAQLHAISSLTVTTDDVVVTGLSVEASPAKNSDGTVGADGETITYGTEGYVLSMSGNPLIECGRASEVAGRVGAMVVGMRFRPFEASGIASPAWQAGDPILVIDGRQRMYRAWLTSYTWKAGGYASLACDAVPPARNGSARASAETKAVVAMRNAVRAERTARERALASMADMLAHSSGLYMTREIQQDGSTVYYMHDKSTLAESAIVWKLTANALGISTDGGVTYPYALDVTGNAILNRIYAIGIDADYITTGRLSAQNGSNFIDLDTGELQLAASAVLGGRTVQQVLDGVAATITGVDVQYAESQSATTAPASGWSSTAPTWREGWYVWQRTATTNASGTSYSTPTCISGREGQDGTGISSTTIEYGTSASAATQPASWSSAAPTSIAEGQWLWTRTTIAYTDGTSSTSYSKSRSGTNGSNGQDGASVTVTAIEYGTSASASTQPASWSASAPSSIAKGSWLWVRTTYSDGGMSTTKSYAGTDGEDGASVYVQSATKTGDTTTVVIADTEGHTSTLTITDGADGASGTPGANGLNGYVHVAWANSADGSTDFSTTVSAGKQYLGTYTDNTAADSADYRSYSWSLIKGAKGDAGEDGTGITSITEQYYLSTSDQTPTGGTWGTTQPTWESGKHIWTRSEIVWDTTPATTTHTTPVLARALTQANSQAKTASDASEANATTLTNLQTQQAIFNLLTGNGTIQGLYMHNGQLYVNASYILGGTLVAGGANNTNGIIQVLDASGNVISQLDNTGASITGDMTLRRTGKAYADGSGATQTSEAKIGVLATTDANVANRLSYWSGNTSGGTLSKAENFYGLTITGRNNSTTGDTLYIIPHTTKSINQTSLGGHSSIATDGALMIVAGLDRTSVAAVNLTRDEAELTYGDGHPNLTGSRNTVLCGSSGISVYSSAVSIGATTSSTTSVKGTLKATNLTVSGTKSRQVATDDYDDRLLYCYETPSPTFGDLGSGETDSEGICVVSIDDIFAETARTDLGYQVFLQKCGAGDLWVAEKRPGYFVVEGTPGLAFDWEVKARQTGYETERLEDMAMRDEAAAAGNADLSIESLYADEFNYIENMERQYEEEINEAA